MMMMICQDGKKKFLTLKKPLKGKPDDGTRKNEKYVFPKKK